MRILCLDIGSGTQDVLYYDPDQNLENCPKFVLPSPARRVARRIRELTRAGRDVYLYGRNMGGGFHQGLTEHLGQGLKAFAHPEAAVALADDLDRVRAQGVDVVDECPRGAAPVHLADFDPGFWEGLLSQAGLEYPDLVMAAVQDHGFHPGTSNRRGRFAIWESLLEASQGRLDGLLFEQVPQEMTRLRTLQECIGGGPVADTGSAALLGALFEPGIERASQEHGVCVVNVGNSHTIGFLVFEDRIQGIFEHHTGLLSPESLWQHLARFRSGRLSNDDVFDDQGHGCTILDTPARAGGYPLIVALGPRRAMLSGCDVQFPAPGGDMMLAGCFGLIKGWKLMQEREPIREPAV